MKDSKRQLEVLFGESLIGSWPELVSNGDLPHRLRPGRSWLWRIGALVTVLALVLAGRALVRPGLERRTAEDRGEYAERLRMSLEDGHVEDAARLVEIVRGTGDSIQASDPHIDIIIRAEAAAYRYFDADPARLRRIQPFIRAGAPAPHSAAAAQARYTLYSREERARHLDELEALRLQHPNDAELEYLVASAREHKADIAGARAAYNRSEALGPAWLSHRFDQLMFERQNGDLGASSRIAEEMMRSDPSSPWSRFAASLAALPVPVLASDAGAALQPFPVQVYRVKLVQAVQAAAQGEDSQATRLLADATSAVNAGPPFVLDAFDYLVQHHALSLARTLRESRDWPKHSAATDTERPEVVPVEGAR